MRVSNAIRLRFWGVRGSIATPVAENLGFGGNTACVEVRLPGGEIAIIDGGTGLRQLGNELMREDGESSLDLHFFLTHFHWDHIQGIPFFQPLYSERNTVSFYAMTAPETTANLLAGLMSSPYFPLEANFLPCGRNFVQLSDRAFSIGESRITSFPLHHPQGCHGYRIQHGSSSVVFASDFEHGDAQCDQTLIRAAEGADVLIFDAQYTPEEYERRRGWGHSTWLEATRVARQAGVKRLFLFHHDPAHDDEAMRGILAEARQEFPETFIAAERQEIQIG
jgi:phosphoribosyl 1,2-cyclic phosphodiesterase